MTRYRRPVPERRRPAAPAARQTTRLPADPRRWSAESRRSVVAQFKRTYEDQHYRCAHCGCTAVYTAAEQKRHLEERHGNINRRRVLCAACFPQWLRLRASLAACQQRWMTARAALRDDEAFLRGWLKLLETYRRYRSPYDAAREGMLRRLLRERFPEPTD